MWDAIKRRISKISFSATVLLAGGVIGLWYAFFVGAIKFIEQGYIDKAGQFGDSFGAINTLFSGLAFVALFFAVMLQRDDLKLQNQTLLQQIEVLNLQKEELKLQREELTQTRMVMEQQKGAQTDQATALLLSARLNALTARYKAVEDEVVYDERNQVLLNSTKRNFAPTTPPSLLEKRNAILEKIESLDRELSKIKSFRDYGTTRQS